MRILRTFDRSGSKSVKIPEKTAICRAQEFAHLRLRALRAFDLACAPSIGTSSRPIGKTGGVRSFGVLDFRVLKRPGGVGVRSNPRRRSPASLAMTRREERSV